jgi:hypothetical protein
MVWAAEPDAVDFGCRDHFRDRRKRARVSDPQLSCQCCGLFGMSRVGTVDAKYIGIAYTTPRLQMKFSHEPATDEAYTKPGGIHYALILL